MKATDSTRVIIAIFVVVGLAVAFWMILLSPKRKEADELSTKVESLQATLAQSQSAVTEAEAARREFPKNYGQLVVLGKAVPAADETSSLLVQLDRISNKSEIDFESIELGVAAGSATEEPVEAEPEASTEEGETGTPVAAVAPTESAAAALPIGAAVGPAGLPVMPYDLLFDGSFFDVADFIQGLDGLVHTEDPGLKVDGRLVTIDGFSLTPDDVGGIEHLESNFSVTTYLVPPGEGLTAGASAGGPTEVATTPEPSEESEEVK